MESLGPNFRSLCILSICNTVNIKSYVYHPKTANAKCVRLKKNNMPDEEQALSRVRKDAPP